MDKNLISYSWIEAIFDIDINDWKIKVSKIIWLAIPGLDN